MGKTPAPLTESEVNQLLSLLQRATGERVQRPRKGRQAEWVAEIHAAMKAPYENLLKVNAEIQRRRMARRY